MNILNEYYELSWHANGSDVGVMEKMVKMTSAFCHICGSSYDTSQLKITSLQVYIIKSFTFSWKFSFYYIVTVMIHVARKSCLISPWKIYVLLDLLKKLTEFVLCDDFSIVIFLHVLCISILFLLHFIWGWRMQMMASHTKLCNKGAIISSFLTCYYFISFSPFWLLLLTGLIGHY